MREAFRYFQEFYLQTRETLVSVKTELLLIPVFYCTACTFVIKNIYVYAQHEVLTQATRRHSTQIGPLGRYWSGSWQCANRYDKGDIEKT